MVLETNDTMQKKKDQSSPLKASNIENIDPDAKGNKRGANTPLSSVKRSSRRKLVEDSRKKNIKYINVNSNDKEEILDLHFQNWMNQENLKKSNQLLDFMSLERKFTKEAINDQNSI